MHIQLLHRHATAKRLGALRLWAFGLWFADVLKDPLERLATVPANLIQPVGLWTLCPADLWPSILTVSVLRTGWLALLALLALTILGTRWHHVAAVAACVGLTLYDSLNLSLTAVSHTSLAALYVSYLLAVFPSADGLSIRRTRSAASPATYAAAMVSIAAVFLLTYSLVGMRRWFVGGLAELQDGSILNLIANRVARTGDVDSLGMMVLQSPWLSLAIQAGFVVLTVCETLSLLCLVSRWFRRAWMGVMVIFHLLSWPLLGILFLHSLLLIPMVLTDVSPPAHDE